MSPVSLEPELHRFISYLNKGQLLRCDVQTEFTQSEKTYIGYVSPRFTKHRNSDRILKMSRQVFIAFSLARGLHEAKEVMAVVQWPALGCRSAVNDGMRLK